jgi:hypothetical protein
MWALLMHPKGGPSGTPINFGGKLNPCSMQKTPNTLKKKLIFKTPPKSRRFTLDTCITPCYFKNALTNFSCPESILYDMHVLMRHCTNCEQKVLKVTARCA